MLLGLIICFMQIDQQPLDLAMVQIRNVYQESKTIPQSSCMFSDNCCGGWFRPGQERALLYGRDDIIIGDEPAETLYISDYFYHNGNIIIINNGVLSVDQADFYLDGDILIYNQGKAFIDSSDLTFLQHYIYQYELYITDSGSCSITHSQTSFNGFPFNVCAIGYGDITIRHVHNEDWITAYIGQWARSDNYQITGHTGEWLYDGVSYGQFHRVENILTWYFLPDSSVIDFDFPEDDTVYGFYIDSTLTNVSGVGFHVEIDSSTQCMWAMIPLAGSDVIVRNSELRVTGLMFSGSDTFDISGLVNGLHYNDWILPVTDRTYHLINTTITTWNLYPTQATNIDLSNSIFGELCSWDSCYTTIMNSFCDGTGGHIEASGQSFVLVFLSSISADVITKDYGICLLAHCSMPYGHIWATGSSIIVLVNSMFPEDPVVSDTSIAFIAGIDAPSEVYNDDTVGILGSAWIDAGPYNPLDFGYYQLFHRVLGDSEWIAIGDSQFVEVHRDTLDYWNTVGLNASTYEVRLVLKDTAGDSIEALKQIIVRPTGISEDEITDNHNREAINVKQIGQRLFSITVGSGDGHVDVRIFDILGRCIHHCSRSVFMWQAPASGVYFVRRADDSDHNITRKMIVY